MKQYTLKVGDSVKVKGGFLTNYALVYAGMPSDSVYSVVVAWSCGYNSMAYNLFLPQQCREFSAAKGRVTVHQVSPVIIEFAYHS